MSLSFFYISYLCNCFSQQGSHFLLHTAWHYITTHGVYLYPFSQYEHSYDLCVSHISRNLASRCLPVYCWHALCRSSSVISPALSHLRSLTCSSWGSSILCHAPMKQPAQQLKDQTQSTHRIMWPVATELMFFLKKLYAKVFSTHPYPHSPEPSLSTTHGHMIAALWVCPLLFARTRVHDAHTWWVSRSTQRARHNKCKGHWEGDCCCTGRHGNTLQSLIVQDMEGIIVRSEACNALLNK